MSTHYRVDGVSPPHSPSYTLDDEQEQEQELIPLEPTQVVHNDNNHHDNDHGNDKVISYSPHRKSTVNEQVIEAAASLSRVLTHAVRVVSPASRKAKCPQIIPSPVSLLNNAQDDSVLAENHDIQHAPMRPNRIQTAQYGDRAFAPVLSRSKVRSASSSPRRSPFISLNNTPTSGAKIAAKSHQTPWLQSQTHEQTDTTQQQNLSPTQSSTVASPHHANPPLLDPPSDCITITPSRRSPHKATPPRTEQQTFEHEHEHAHAHPSPPNTISHVSHMRRRSSHHAQHRRFHSMNDASSKRAVAVTVTNNSNVTVPHGFMSEALPFPLSMTASNSHAGGGENMHSPPSVLSFTDLDSVTPPHSRDASGASIASSMLLGTSSDTGASAHAQPPQKGQEQVRAEPTDGEVHVEPLQSHCIETPNLLSSPTSQSACGRVGIRLPSPISMNDIDLDGFESDTPSLDLEMSNRQIDDVQEPDTHMSTDSSPAFDIPRVHSRSELSSTNRLLVDESDPAADTEVVSESEHTPATAAIAVPSLSPKSSPTARRKSKRDVSLTTAPGTTMRVQPRLKYVGEFSQSLDGMSPSAAYERRRLQEKAILRFNSKPKAGIFFLMSKKLIDDSPDSVADFLLSAPGLNKAKVGEYLGNSDPFCIAVMIAYLNRMDFTGRTFDSALRYFLSGFRLPGEAQQIDRLMEKFAERFCRDNPDVFPDVDAANLLAFALIMLNTDAHSDKVKHKMTKKQFLRNTDTISGRGVEIEYLSACYDRIVSDEIRISYDYLEQLYARVMAGSVNSIQYRARRRASTGHVRLPSLSTALNVSDVSVVHGSSNNVSDISSISHRQTDSKSGLDTCIESPGRSVLNGHRSPSDNRGRRRRRGLTFSSSSSLQMLQSLSSDNIYDSASDTTTDETEPDSKQLAPEHKQHSRRPSAAAALHRHPRAPSTDMTVSMVDLNFDDDISDISGVGPDTSAMNDSRHHARHHSRHHSRSHSNGLGRWLQSKLSPVAPSQSCASLVEHHWDKLNDAREFGMLHSSSESSLQRSSTWRCVYDEHNHLTPLADSSIADVHRLRHLGFDAPENIFMKYGRRGSPHARKLWISGNLEQILWQDAKKGRNPRAICTRDIVDVRVGRDVSDVLRRHDIDSTKDSLCLSIETAQRTLDLEAESPAQMKRWLDFLTAVVAENQLRDEQVRERVRIQERDAFIERLVSKWNKFMLPNWKTVTSPILADKHDCSGTVAPIAPQRMSARFARIWRRGIPPAFRPKAWRTALELGVYDSCDSKMSTGARLSSCAHKYTSNAPSDIVHDIDADIAVTLPELKVFHANGEYLLGQDLRLLLIAFAAKHLPRGCNYVSGLAHIGAMLLLILPLDEADACFDALARTQFLHTYITLDKSLLNSRIRAFDSQLQLEAPMLHAHFGHLTLRSDMFLVDWCRSMFAAALPLDIAARVWDLFLLEGEVAVYSVGLTVLVYFQERLLRSSFTDCMFLLHNGAQDMDEAMFWDLYDSVKLDAAAFMLCLPEAGGHVHYRLHMANY
jgi:Sec7 domain/Rab-GTPase-TBC domain